MSNVIGNGNSIVPDSLSSSTPLPHIKKGDATRTLLNTESKSESDSPNGPSGSNQQPNLLSAVSTAHTSVKQSIAGDSNVTETELAGPLQTLEAAATDDSRINDAIEHEVAHFMNDHQLFLTTLAAALSDLSARSN